MLHRNETNIGLLDLFLTADRAEASDYSTILFYAKYASNFIKKFLLGPIRDLDASV